MADVYIPLLTYKHANGEEGSEVIPGLAKELPKISNGGKTYTLFLRPGLKYSDGTPVKASDFPFLDRTDVQAQLRPARPSTPTIDGAEKFAETKQGGDPGDQNQRQDRRNRHQPEANPRGTFTNELGMMFVGAAAAGHAGRRPLGQPAPGTGALHDHQIAAGQRLGIRTQPVLGEGQRKGDARPARRRASTAPRSRSSATRRRRSTTSNRAPTTGCRTRRPPRATRKSKKNTKAPSSGSSRRSAPTTSG